MWVCVDSVTSYQYFRPAGNQDGLHRVNISEGLWDRKLSAPHGKSIFNHNFCKKIKFARC